MESSSMTLIRFFRRSQGLNRAFTRNLRKKWEDTDKKKSEGKCMRLGRCMSMGMGIERTPDAGDTEDVVRRPRRTVIWPTPFLARNISPRCFLPVYTWAPVHLRVHVTAFAHYISMGSYKYLSILQLIWFDCSDSWSAQKRVDNKFNLSCIRRGAHTFP